MKKILILGAGIYQVPLIKEAKKMNLYTIVSSIKGNYPGFQYADKVYYVDTTDKEKILDIAKAEKIDGICTTGTDVAVLTLGYVCEHLNLSGISFDTAQKVTNKLLMKMAFYENGISSPLFYKITNISDIFKYLADFNNDAILKVVDKSGSRGIIRISDKSDIHKIFNECMSITKKDYLILEKYISGTEIGIDAFIQNKKLILLEPHSKIMYETDGKHIPIGHIVPYNCSEVLYRKIENEVNNLIKAFNLDNCAINIDSIIQDGVLNIIEFGARAGATGIPEIISLHHNTNYYKIILECALGNSVNINHADNMAYASHLLFSEKDGIFKSFVCNSKFYKYELDYLPNTKVDKFSDGTKRIGQIIFCSNDTASLMNDISAFSKNSKINIE